MACPIGHLIEAKAPVGVGLGRIPSRRFVDARRRRPARPSVAPRHRRAAYPRRRRCGPPPAPGEPAWRRTIASGAGRRTARGPRPGARSHRPRQSRDASRPARSSEPSALVAIGGGLGGDRVLVAPLGLRFDALELHPRGHAVARGALWWQDRRRGPSITIPSAGVKPCASSRSSISSMPAGTFTSAQRTIAAGVHVDLRRRAVSLSGVGSAHILGLEPGGHLAKLIPSSPVARP